MKSIDNVMNLTGETHDSPDSEHLEEVDRGDSMKKRVKRTYVTSRRKTKQPYWDDFNQYKDENDRLRAECKHCKKTYACDSNMNGTKNVKNHWPSCTKNPANKGKGKQAQLIFENSNDSTLKMKNWVFDAKNVREAVTEMIIKDEMPFRSVEKDGLKNAFFVVCPTFNMPSRTTVSRDCFKLYLKERENLKYFLRVSCQRVCLTTDTWTSMQMDNYMCVTAHLIDDDWKLQKRIVNFCLIYSHKGEAIGRALEDCLSYWGLSDKLLTVTVDNASANDVACSYLQEIAKGNGCIGEGKYVHMRCMSHIINLIVKDGLKLCGDYVNKVRAIVKYIRGSPSRLHAFRQQVEKCKIECKSSLCSDVPTKWNSTYLMLSVALKFKFAIARMEIPTLDEMNLGHITSSDWNKIETLTTFLKEFYNLTNRVSGSSYVTGNFMILHILQAVKVLNRMASTNDYALKAMANDMKVKCDKYWGSIGRMNMLMFLAVILDPFYKLRGLQVAISGIFGEENADNLVGTLKEFAYGLFDEYKSIYSPLNTTSGDSSLSRPSAMDDYENCWITELNEQIMRGTSQHGDFSRSEFDSYLIETKGDHEEKYILNWWKLNTPRYPTLARMARDILAIPISTVPSESAFSAGGRTLDQWRGSLDPSMVQALVCTEDWLRARDKKKKYDEEECLNEVDHLRQDLEENIKIGEGTFYVTS